MASFEIRSAAAILLVFVVVAAYQVEKSAGATTYVVGDSIGWTIPAGGAGSYASWASGHTFVPGDDLVFNFPTGVHDVAKVDKASFDSCSASNPTTLATVGPSTITLTTEVNQFFICTFGVHCSLGQKLTLKVSGASTSPPAPSPNATVSTPPPTPAAAPPKATPSTPSSSPPTAAAAAPKATPSTPSPSPPTAAAPKGATPSTPSSSPPTAAAPKAAIPSTPSSSPPTAATPAKSPAVTPSSATPPSTSSISPTIAPASTSGGPGGPEVPSSAFSPGGSGPGGVIAPGPGTGLGPSGSTPQSSGSATKIAAVSTLLGLIVAIAGGIAFVGY